MAKQTFKVTVDDRELMKAFERVPFEMARKPLRRGVHKAAMFVAREAHGKVPVLTGRLQSSIQVRGLPVVRANFQLRHAKRTGFATGRRQRMKVRSQVIAGWTRKAYASWIELGTDQRTDPNRGYIDVSQTRFLRPALYDNARRVAMMVRYELARFLFRRRI